MFALVICGFLTLFVDATNTELTKDSSRCLQKKHDLFIVVDGSKYVGAREFHLMKKFLQQIVFQLDVGLGKTHVGLLSVSSKARTKIAISLGQYDSHRALSNALRRIRRTAGRKRPDMGYALELVQNKVFTDKEGDRPNKDDVLILFTNRIDPINLETVVKRADTLKSRGVEIITVALQTTNILWNFRDELTAIASSSGNVLTLQSSHLKKLKRTFNRSCLHKRAMQPAKGCIRNHHDVFFLLDGSGSISLKHFKKMKQFLVKLIKELNIGPHTTHVGLLQFSHKLKTKIEFKLGEYQTLAEVKNAIDRIPYQEGGTETGNALAIVNKEVFPRTGSYRPNVSDIVVIITDGEARDQNLAFYEAAVLRRKGVQIVAVGMGEENTVATFRQDLQLMASKPSDVFTANFRDLRYLVEAVTSDICLARPPKAVKCARQKRDILLVVDSSSSVGAVNMKKVKRFLKKLVMELNIGKSRNHIGLLQFSEVSKTRLEFYLDQYYDTKKIRRAIRKMNYESGLQTMIGHALGMADKKIFTGRLGDRPQVNDVVILVADGGAHDKLEALQNAAILKKRGVHLITVYVQNYYDDESAKKLLLEIASSPSDFYTTNFDELKYIAADLMKIVCSDDLGMGSPGSLTNLP